MYCLIRFVKLFTQLVCLYFTIILADAATTTVTVEGQQYTVTYETTRYDGNASQFKSTLWWGDSSTAKSFANATSVNSVVYAHELDSSFVKFDKKSYNIIGWQMLDIFQNQSITYLHSIIKNQEIKKDLFKIPIQN